MKILVPAILSILLTGCRIITTDPSLIADAPIGCPHNGKIEYVKERHWNEIKRLSYVQVMEEQLVADKLDGKDNPVIEKVVEYLKDRNNPQIEITRTLIPNENCTSYTLYHDINSLDVEEESNGISEENVVFREFIYSRRMSSYSILTTKNRYWIAVISGQHPDLFGDRNPDSKAIFLFKDNADRLRFRVMWRESEIHNYIHGTEGTASESTSNNPFSNISPSSKSTKYYKDDWPYLGTLEELKKVAIGVIDSETWWDEFVEQKSKIILH